MIRQISQAEEVFASNLFVEYEKESSVLKRIPANPDVETYQALLNIGCLVCFGAYVDNKMVGFISVLSHTAPHYGVRISVTESFFVSIEYRSKGIGVKLLREAERYAKSIDSKYLMISAPVGSQLEKLMHTHKHYEPSNAIFLRSLV